MGANPRYRLWTTENWRSSAPTVADVKRAGWAVYALCARCDLRMTVDLDVIIQAKGGSFVLWGRTVRCRRLHCWGRAVFVCRPPRGEGDVVMSGR
jgi:hypothetical protein